MYSRNDIVEGARTIRPLLGRLLRSTTRAAHVDLALADLLERHRQGDDVADEILEVIGRDAGTREWMRRFLQAGAAPEVTRSYKPPPGDPSLPPAPGYRCPRGDYVWYRSSPGEKIPSCPTHRIPLTKVAP